jgi:hypothetical protein
MTLWTLGMVDRLDASSPSRVPAAAYARACARGDGAAGRAAWRCPTLWLVLPFALGAYLVGGVGHGTKNVVVRYAHPYARARRTARRAWAQYSAARNGASSCPRRGGACSSPRSARAGRCSPRR